MLYRDTSRAAWDHFKVCASDTLDEKILAALKYYRRATCQEIEAAIDRDHQSVSGNLRHLVERHLVRATGQHGLTRSGRKAIKWELVPALTAPAALELEACA